MDENESSSVRPVVKRGEGWQNRQQKREKYEASDKKVEDKMETTPRQSTPLPFGKIDLFA